MSDVDILRPDNHALFDRIRLMLVAQPTISFQFIADEFAVTPRELVVWFLAYKAPRGRRTAYQSPRFPAIGEPLKSNREPDEEKSEHARRMRTWRKQRDGARLALEGAKH